MWAKTKLSNWKREETTVMLILYSYFMKRVILVLDHSKFRNNSYFYGLGFMAEIHKSIELGLYDRCRANCNK